MTLNPFANFTTAILRLVILLFVFSVTGLSQEKVKTVIAELRGKIVNVVGIPIPNAEIEFESLFEIQATKTDKDGNYKIQLYPTTYRISVKKWIGKLDFPKDGISRPTDCSSYFREVQRSGFTLTKWTSSEINFILSQAECLINPEKTSMYEGSEKTNDYYGMFSNPSHHPLYPRIRYETVLYADKQFDGKVDLVIQFGDREERNNKIIYKPGIDFVYFKDTSTENNLKHPFAGVIITYNLFTLYVTEAEFDKNKNEISAIGKIVVEDGSKKYKAKKLLIKIINQTAEIQISK